MISADRFRAAIGLDQKGPATRMDEDFNPDDLRPIPYRPDTELTLGPMLLGCLLFVLILLCGICFFVGYAMGKRGAHNLPSVSQRQGAPTSQSGAETVPKPAAAPPSGTRARTYANGQRTSGETASDSDSSAQGSAHSIVRPALPDSATAAMSGQPVPPGALMVQIAAVSHREDADVLVGALRKRGFAVNVRRDPADNLIHVRIGPFASRDEANATRQKLLNDGYNAIVQP